MSKEEKGIPVEETRSEVAAQAASSEPVSKPFTNQTVRQATFKLFVEGSQSLFDNTTQVRLDTANKRFSVKFKLERELDVLAYMQLAANQTISTIFEFGTLQFRLTLLIEFVEPLEFKTLSENNIQGELETKIVEIIPLQKIELEDN